MPKYSKVYFLLLSGGMDSTIAGLKIIEAGDHPIIIPVFVNYGQKSVEEEWDSVKKVTEKMKTLSGDKRLTLKPPVRIDLTTEEDFGIFDWSKSKLITGNSQADAYVENRNMILISVVASYAESVITEQEEAVIITGFRDEFEDTSPAFRDAINHVFKILHNRVRVETPIIDFKDKRRLVKKHEKYLKFLNLTWSCYTPVDGEPCGICEACTSRQRALKTVR